MEQAMKSLHHQVLLMPIKRFQPQKKRLIYIEDAKHRMLYDGRMEQTVFTLIEQMLEGKIF